MLGASSAVTILWILYRQVESELLCRIRDQAVAGILAKWRPNIAASSLPTFLGWSRDRRCPPSFRFRLSLGFAFAFRHLSRLDSLQTLHRQVADCGTILITYGSMMMAVYDTGCSQSCHKLSAQEFRYNALGSDHSCHLRPLQG